MFKYSSPYGYIGTRYFRGSVYRSIRASEENHLPLTVRSVVFALCPSTLGSSPTTHRAPPVFLIRVTWPISSPHYYSPLPTVASDSFCRSSAKIITDTYTTLSVPSEQPRVTFRLTVTLQCIPPPLRSLNRIGSHASSCEGQHISCPAVGVDIR